MSFLGKEIYMAFLENAHKQTTKRNLEHHKIKTSHLKPDIKIVCIFLKNSNEFLLVPWPVRAGSKGKIFANPCTLGPVSLSAVYSWYFSQTCFGVTSGKMMFLGNKST